MPKTSCAQVIAAAGATVTMLETRRESRHAGDAKRCINDQLLTVYWLQSACSGRPALNADRRHGGERLCSFFVGK
jgi:hypothetical protein